jgi:hypothetical protein
VSERGFEEACGATEGDVLASAFLGLIVATRTPPAFQLLDLAAELAPRHGNLRPKGGAK